ncbi:hypothetical protein [Congregibacter sp.]|uniref:hypothetical protein n=1 Tax=Congregibacter sp. TaxID=2744308 RepID=UPI003F6D66F9
MRIALTLTVGALICQPLTSFADPCMDVVADTVAEMRAGADGWWNEDIEGLVRAAAGSACIKAQSKRYRAAGDVLSKEESVSSLAAPSQASDTSGAQNASGPTGEAANAQEEDDGSWSIGGLTIRSMSGSPSQKPYERARQTKQADLEQENDSGREW